MNPNKNLTKLYIGMLILVISLAGIGDIVASDSVSDTNILLTSRFILWDKYEKMIDNNFTIHIIYNNNSINNTAYYNITIDEFYYNGIIHKYKSINLNFTNREIIEKIDIEINNQSVFTVTNIMIIEGVTKSSVRRGLDDFLISLSPFEWKSKEWNIFYGVIIASILAIFISLLMVKWYRTKKGVTEIK